MNYEIKINDEVKQYLTSAISTAGNQPTHCNTDIYNNITKAIELSNIPSELNVQFYLKDTYLIGNWLDIQRIQDNPNADAVELLAYIIVNRCSKDITQTNNITGNGFVLCEG